MGGEDLSKERMGERDMGPAMASLQQPLSTQPLSQNQNQNQIQNQNQQSSSAANSSTNSLRGANFGKMEPADEFPAGMRVLVVDDDPMCLMVLERMLRTCSYQVTTCGRAAKALELLREDKDKFDLVISDVYMPDMDGFKLLELVGLEMDLPVIMMSANGETSAVMKGITHGACDYLLKPVRVEELRNIWQHVVRKKRQESKEVEHSTSLDEGGDRQKRVGVEDADYTSSATDTTDGNWKLSKRKKESKEEEEDNEQENDDPSTLKKPRVVWSVELHQQFVSAVNQLGIDKAVPKRILELMSVHGLTRENVASHLQKYRLYLKRLSGVTSQQNNMNAPFGGPDAFPMISADLAGGLPFATFHSNILGRMPSNGMLQNCLDPSIMGQFGTHDSPRPRVNGALLNTSGLLPSLPGGIHLDSVPQSHHLSALNQLDDLPSLKALHQLNQSSGIGMGTLGAPIPSANNEALLMHQLFQPRASPQGATSSLNLSQSTSGLGTPHLLSSDINLGNAGPLPNLGGNIGTGVGLSAMGGPVGRGLSPSLGGTAASLSSSLGSLLPRAPIADQSLNLVNSTGGTFSVASSVQSPKPGSATGPPPTMNEGSSQQQSMRAPYNPLTHLNQALSPASTHNSRPMWSGTAGNLGLGDLGQSISPGLSPRFSTQSPNSGGGFATPSHHGQQGHGAYMSQTASYPVRLALEGGMGRPSLNGGHSSREQLDMEQKLMKDDRTRESLISAKLEGGLLHPDAPEEFFGYYFKQPHEGMGGFSECDLPEDGYNPLDNLYVK